MLTALGSFFEKEIYKKNMCYSKSLSGYYDKAKGKGDIEEQTGHETIHMKPDLYLPSGMYEK